MQLCPKLAFTFIYLRKASKREKLSPLFGCILRLTFATSDSFCLIASQLYFYRCFLNIVKRLAVAVHHRALNKSHLLLLLLLLKLNRRLTASSGRLPLFRSFQNNSNQPEMTVPGGKPPVEF